MKLYLFGLLVTLAVILQIPVAQAASLSDSGWVQFSGVTADDRTGSSTATGDINGDGYDDLIIGAPRRDTNGSNSGSVFLIYGSATALTSASVSSAVEFYGETGNDQFGSSVANAGDVNGDGYDDVIIGAPQNDSAGNNAGAAYLLYGQAAAFTSESIATHGIRFSGEAASDVAGSAVSSAGDLNADGYADFLIGAYANSSSAGAVYLLYGQATAFTTVSLSTANKFTGEAAGDVAGYAVSGAGDVNGDGYDDFMIGAIRNNDGGIWAGAAYLFYGQSDKLNSPVSVSSGIEFTGEAASDQGGASVSGADVNGDGYSDLLINSIANGNVGAVYLIYGQSTQLTAASLTTAIKFSGEAENDSLGFPVSRVGDIDRDGYEDFIAGATNNDDGAGGAGAAYVMYGQAAAFTSESIAVHATEFTGVTLSDGAGNAVTGGDINGDGFSDVMVAANHFNVSSSDEGIVYLAYFYIDADGDGVAGTSGLLAIGSDCNDSDSTVSANQTYYLDADGDGLGISTSTTSVCASTAPSGYADNTDDTDDTIAFSDHQVSTVIGNENGAITITYNDDFQATYTIFTVSSSHLTVVAQRPNSNLVVAVHPRAKKIALVNGLTGEVLSRKVLNRKAHSKIKLLVKDLRSDNKYEAIVVAKRRTKKIHLDLFSIRTTSLKRRDGATIINRHILPRKTRARHRKIKLRRLDGKVLVEFRVGRLYKLTQL